MTKFNRAGFLAALLALALFSFTACDSDSSSDDNPGTSDVIEADGEHHDDHDGEHHDEHDGEHHGVDLDELAEHACVHFQTGPYADLTAGATAAEAAGLTPGHTLQNLTLPAADAPGYLTVTLDHEAELFVALSAAGTLVVTDADGTAIAPEHDEDVSAHCSAIALFQMFHLEAGTYTLAVATADGATTLDLLSNVIEADHDDHDDHDDHE